MVARMFTCLCVFLAALQLASSGLGVPYEDLVSLPLQTVQITEILGETIG